MTQLFKRTAIIVASLIMLSAPSWSAPKADSVDSLQASQYQPIKVSLITFYPGDEIFEVFGHSEILVTKGSDSYYFNYGVFDFNSPNFMMRYAKGETDYMCDIMPPSVDGGIRQGRKMIKQDLNLTPKQAQQVLDMLMTNVKPENRVYRYRHFSDNCATRPRDIIEKTLNKKIDYTKCDYIVGKTLRQIVDYYSRNYAWERFGIDLVLGAACDTVVEARTQTFVPLFLMNAVNTVTVDNGNGPEKLVTNTEILMDGDDNGLVMPPTPWYMHPLTFSILLLLIATAITTRDWRRGKLSRWFDSILFTLAGLAGCLLFFIVFCSTHEGVSPNFNTLWMHPLLLLLAILPWIKKASKVLRWLHIINIALIATMTIIWLSGLQVANAAFYPLITTLLLRSLANVKKVSIPLKTETEKTKTEKTAK